MLDHQYGHRRGCAHHECLPKLFETGAYSDLTITCGEDRYAVHKAIVCTRSPFFAAACNGMFQEANTGQIDLPEDDPAAVKMMIQFLYLHAYKTPEVFILTHSRNLLIELHEEEYSEEEKQRLEILGYHFEGNRIIRRFVETDYAVTNERLATPASSQNIQPQNLVLHARVYALGEKYGIIDMKAFALKKFMEEAGRHHHTSSFCEAAREVYTSTIEQDRAMRDAVIATVQAYPNMFSSDVFLGVVKDTELAFDLLMCFAGPFR